MTERRIRLLVPRIDPVGSGRYSIMCWRCRRSAVVVARTSAAAWLLLAADGWHHSASPNCLASCPECADSKAS